MPDELHGNTKVTEEVVAKLEECFRNGWTVQDACFEAKISVSTYARHLESDEIFRERIRYSQGSLKRLAKRSLVKAIPNNPSIALETLSRIAKDEGWSPRTELTGPSGTPLGYVYSSDLKQLKEGHAIPIDKAEEIPLLPEASPSQEVG